MINGVLLDSIGLALFSLAWWGWLIGGGLAVVGMLFGMHVAVGAPEAQASSSDYQAEIADALNRGDVGAAAQIQAQSQPGYSGPSKEAQMADALSSGDTDRYLEHKGDTQAQLGNALSRGDIGAAAKLAQQQQQEYMNAPKVGPVTRPLTQEEIAEREAKKAASENNFVYNGVEGLSQAEAYAQWEKDMAAWEAQYGGGGGGAPSGGGGAPVPAAPPPGNPHSVEHQIGEWQQRLERYNAQGQTQLAQYATEELKRLQSPLAYGQGVFNERLHEAMNTAPEGSDYNEEKLNALAIDVAAGELERIGSLPAAIADAEYRVSNLSDPVNAWAQSNRTQLALTEKMLDIYKQQAPPPVAEVAFKAKGAQVDPTYTPSDDGGTLDIAMKAKARAGSSVKIQVMEYNPDKGRMVVVDTTKAKVDKSGKIHTAVEADAGDVIMVKKNTGKKLAQIEIPGQ